MNKRPLLGAVELGGAKFVLAVGHSPTEIVARKVIETTRPDSTLAEAADWLSSQGDLDGVGIASFGPVEIDPQEPKWGFITDTPKPFWANRDVAGHFKRHLDVPVGFDTDVSAAALGEYEFGAGVGKHSLAYITVGTGIGGGLVVDGIPLRGAGHLEMGHMYPKSRHEGDGLRGYCPYHTDCIEGLVSGAAIEKRWGSNLSSLPANHEAQGIVADYLGQLCHAVFAMTAAEVIVLGGGVMKTPGLVGRVRHRTLSIGGHYFPGRRKQQIVPPALEDDSGITGAMILARNAVHEI